MRELSPEEQDLGGVIDPEQKQDQGTGCPERGSGGAVPQIDADEGLAQGKEQGGDERSHPDMAPADPCVRQELEDERKQHRDHAQRYDQVQKLQDKLRDGKDIAKGLLSRGEPGGHHQGNEQQEPNPQDHGEGKQAVQQDLLERCQEAPGFLHFDIPDDVQRGVQLVEDPQGAEQQGQDPDGKSKNTFPCAACVCHQAGDKLSALRPDQALHLAQDLYPHGACIPDQPRHGDDDDQ